MFLFNCSFFLQSRTFTATRGDSLKALITASVLLSSAALIGCNPNAVLETRKAQAPQQEADTGYIVKVQSEQDIVDLLNHNPNAEYRLLNKNYELYEIFNLPEKQLAESKIQVISKNKIVKTSPRTMDLGIHDLAIAQKKNLPNCKSRTQQGDIKIKDADSINMKSVLQGTLELQPTEIKSENKHYWLVAAPVGSKYHTKSRMPYIEQVDKFQFSPDSLGAHAIQLMVETPEKRCELHTIQTLITKNTPYKKLSTTSYSETNASTLDLHHLEMIKAYEAQDYAKGEGVVVAVIDTGLNYLHKDINAQIHVNEKEIPNNGLDDDGNGFIDDYAGYDFQNDDSHAYDDSGHGSHVSGLIAGTNHGVAPNAKILPLKALSDFGGDLGSIYAAVLYAVQNKVDVINMSLGHGGSPDPFETFALSKAEEAGVLVVTAAGNGNQFGIGINTDRSAVYPANLPHKNILNVAAMSFDKDITKYSNYGRTTVDISAPGGSPKFPIESLSHENPLNAPYAKMMGTSMAAPVTTGAVALALSLNPEFTPQQTIKKTLESGTDVESLKHRTVSGKMINVMNMVYQNRINQFLTAN